MPPGSELTWGALAGGPEPFPIARDFYRYFVFNDANWDWKTMDFDKDVAAGEEKLAKVLDATDPNLRAFKARGGKLILYHGWNDQLISAYNTINYFNNVSKTMGATGTDEFARLLMAPGMLHCGGGTGPSAFDAVTALEQWVELGTKPHTRAMVWSIARARCVRTRKWLSTRERAALTKRAASRASERTIHARSLHESCYFLSPGGMANRWSVVRGHRRRPATSLTGPPGADL